MYSAWLEQASGEWHRTTNHTRILDHDGNFVICNDETDDLLAVEKIAAESGKFASRSHDRITLSDCPVFASLTEEAQRLAIAGVPCLLLPHSLSYTRDGFAFESVPYSFKTETLGGKKVQWHCGGWDKQASPEKPGFVVVGENELRYDLGLWQKCKDLETRRDRKKFENPQIERYSFKYVANKLAKNMGMSEIKSFRIEQFVVWILAHDQFFGRRATNKEIRWLAKSWSKNSESYRKQHKRWVSETVLDKLEERFRSVVKFPEAK